MGEMLTDQVLTEFLPHFDGLAQGKIQFPYCSDCSRFHWYPMPRCPHCRSSAILWKAVAGGARLYSWTVVRHAFQPSLEDQLPYVVALVTFDDAPGVRLITNLVRAEPDALRCDMALRPVFDNPPDARPKVRFRPA